MLQKYYRNKWVTALALAFISCAKPPAHRDYDTVFADTTGWSRANAVSAPISLLIPPTFRRAIDPPDSWGSNIDTGELYTEVTTNAGDVIIPFIPLPTWMTLKKDYRRWTTKVRDVQIIRASYIERVTSPDYYIETAKVPISDTSWFNLAVVAYSPTIRPVAASIFRSIIANKLAARSRPPVR